MKSSRLKEYMTRIRARQGLDVDAPPGEVPASVAAQTMMRMKCSPWRRVPFYTPGQPGGIFSSSCEHRGRRYKMQIMCSSRPGGGCHGFVWPPDRDAVGLLGPIGGQNLRLTAGKLHSVMDWYESKRR